MRLTVAKEYHRFYTDPIRVCAGDVLTWELRETDWPGWVWCTALNQKSGWVPKAYLTMGEAQAVVLRDYDARELEVKAGDSVGVLHEESGWLWCTDARGDRGWLPKEVFAAGELSAALYGVDLDLLEANRSLSYEDRLKQHDSALALVREFEKAREKLYPQPQ